MTSRERIERVLSHELPDRIPCDFGGSSVTGTPVENILAMFEAYREGRGRL